MFVRHQALPLRHAGDKGRNRHHGLAVIPLERADLQERSGPHAAGITGGAHRRKRMIRSGGVIAEDFSGLLSDEERTEIRQHLHHRFKVFFPYADLQMFAISSEIAHASSRDSARITSP